MSRLAEITVFTKDGGPLTKRIALLKNGTFRADGAECRMGSGTARRHPVPDVNALAATIDRLESNQALALGRLRGDLPDEVSITTKSQLGRGDTNAIARTTENFEFTPGVPAYALLDFDEKGMPDEVRQNIEAIGGVWETLCAVLPALERTAHVTRRSTSAGLYRSDTGEKLPGSNGMHVYVLVADGADIGRFLAELHNRAWLAGFGWHGIGAGGKLLERSIVDRMVGSPERLVFEGKPVLKAPLAQDAEHRRPVAVDGTALDTATSCPALSEAEVSRLHELRADSIRRLAPEADRARLEFVKQKAESISARTGKSAAEARRIADRWAGGVLSADVVLPFDRQEFAGCSVADVLADPTRFAGQTLSDPLEGEAYGRCKAKIIRRYGELCVASHAHGGCVYTLEGARVAAEDEFDEAFLGKRFHLVPFNDLRLQTKNRYLVKGLIPGTGLIVVWGPPKGGKSFWVGDVMLHVAQGWDYRGRKVARGTVIYCAMEGAAGYGARFEAMRQQYKIEPRAHVPLYLLATPMKLVRDHKTLIDDITTHLGDTSPPVAIVLDTLNRSISGSESSDADMSDYLAAADALWNEFGCAVILVHHCGWDETRPRGHTSLPGAIEAQIAVKRDGPREGGKFTATVELMKDGREGDVIQSRLDVVRVGTDDDGDPITTCIVQPTGGDEFEQTPLTPGAEQMWDAFQVAAKEAGGLEEWRITPVSTDVWEQTYCNLFDRVIGKSTQSSGTSGGSAEVPRASGKAVSARYLREMRQYIKDSGRVKKHDDNQWVAL